MLDVLTQVFPFREATVVALAPDGTVTVRDDAEAEVQCRRVQISEGPMLTLTEGARVLVVASPGAQTGYVLGRIAPAGPAPPVSPGRVVEVVVPDGVETVRITGKRVRIAADEEITLECGGGSVRIDGRGKVVVLGTDITSRAKRLHKVKGASVAIN